MPPRATTLDIHPLTPERWKDLEKLFGERGACGGCWCMLWRVSRSVFEAQKGNGNKRAMKKLVAAGRVPGLLAYLDGEPVGWCAVAPREQYVALQRSRLFRSLDSEPAWVVSCFFVARPYRRKRISVALLNAAVEHVRARGGCIVEGYPQEPKADPMPDVFAWTGFASAFHKAGFREVARPTSTRPIMRHVIG
jgi:GNAT superfamily N-acetyltransferase